MTLNDLCAAYAKHIKNKTMFLADSELVQPFHHTKLDIRSASVAISALDFALNLLSKKEAATPTPATNLQRFEPDSSGEGAMLVTFMTEDKDGDWVRYSDAMAEIERLKSFDGAWTKVFYALLEARPSAINNEPRGIDGALRAIAELELERDTAIWMAAKHEITIAAAFIGLLHGTADDWLCNGLEGSELPYQDAEDDQAFYDQQMAILGDIPTAKVKP